MLARASLPLTLVFLTSVALAQDARDTVAARAEKEDVSLTSGEVTISVKKVEYQASAGRLPLEDKAGKRIANIFFVAYTKKGIKDASTRPITFCFNGGPGSSSVWLHLGAFSPRRVLLSDEGNALPPPARLVENQWSLLDLTDLVFIDPVSTGYSRAVTPEAARQFHGVQKDVESFGEFIRQY